MKIPGVSAKLSAAIIAGVLFFIISNPIVYKLAEARWGGLLGPIASPDGRPTTWGLILHSALFATAIYFGAAA